MAGNKKGEINPAYFFPENPSQKTDVLRPFTSLPHPDNFNFPPTVRQKGMLSKRKLFHLPYNTDQMTDSLSPSSLSEFKSSNMVRISNNGKAAGFCRKSLSTLHYAVCSEETLVLVFILTLNLIYVSLANSLK